MDLAFYESLPSVKSIIVGLSSIYFKQKAIGNRPIADRMGESLKALHIYAAILEYYYTDEEVDIPVLYSDIKEVYNKFKQVYYSVKSNSYGI